jgi:hypothetical protein
MQILETGRCPIRYGENADPLLVNQDRESLISDRLTPNAEQKMHHHIIDTQMLSTCSEMGHPHHAKPPQTLEDNNLLNSILADEISMLEEAKNHPLIL